MNIASETYNPYVFDGNNYLHKFDTFNVLKNHTCQILALQQNKIKEEYHHNLTSCLNFKLMELNIDLVSRISTVRNFFFNMKI